MSDKIEKTKKFVRKHKTVFFIAGISTVTIIGIAIGAGYKINAMGKVIDAQNYHIMHLENACKAKDFRIEELVDICNKKDAVFKGMISDGLRHGSSTAGRHMVDRKLYLLRQAA